ncbi:MAG TPA: ATP-binding protein, partial [Solirubrobacteraceae bacterium]|nr:ATP-binding protein [Solirubrobacteraceae bacterium]
MPRPAGVAPDQLRRRCTADEIPWESTAQVGDSAPAKGQPRALEALAFADAMPPDGYHVFATGPPGTGKRALLEAWLRERAALRPSPPDLVYVFNFDDRLRPVAFALPSGSAPRFASDVRTLVEEAGRRITEAFDSEGFRTRHRALHDELEGRRRAILQRLDERAHAANVALQVTPGGVVSVPMAGGRPLQPDEISGMAPEARKRYEEAVHDLEHPVDETFARLHELDREARERHEALTHDVALFAISRLVEDLQRRWTQVDDVGPWLTALRDDLIANLVVFRDAEEHAAQLPTALGGPPSAEDLRARYEVNVLVSHDGEAGAPVVFATDASYWDLFGRAEYETAFGAAVTDHRHLRAGAVHRASGGWLVVQALDVLVKPFVWSRLKDVLRTRRLRIENIAAQYLMFPAVALEPEPIDADLTVVVVSSPELYELLHAADEDVARLFKVRADFDAEMPRDEGGVAAYAGLLGALVRERGLRDFDRGAIAALVEFGSRLAGDQDRLSARVREIHDVATEAAHLAAGRGHRLVHAGDVERALRLRRRRSDLIEQRVRERTVEGTLRIDVRGTVAGQVNGLAVAALGDQAFGHPVRITATVAPG